MKKGLWGFRQITIIIIIFCFSIVVYILFFVSWNLFLVAKACFATGLILLRSVNVNVIVSLCMIIVLMQFALFRNAVAL